MLSKDVKIDINNYNVISECNGTTAGNGILIAYSVRHGCVIRSIINTDETQSITINLYINKETFCNGINGKGEKTVEHY